MKIRTGFTTRGAALQALRSFFSKYEAHRCNLTYVGLERYLRAYAGQKLTQVHEEGDKQAILEVSRSGLFYMDLSAPMPAMASWLAAMCFKNHQVKHPIVMTFDNGGCKTTCEGGLAILAVWLVPGGDRVAPMIVDLVVDGDFG